MQSQTLKGFLAGVTLTLVATVGLAGLTGFQGASQKVGMVDYSRAANDSEAGKKVANEVRGAFEARRGVLEFFKTYPTVDASSAKRFQELSLKAAPTDAERAELDRLKASIVAEEQKSRALTAKANPTQDDLKLVESYQTRASAATRNLLNNLAQELRQRHAQKADRRQRAKDALRPGEQGRSPRSGARRATRVIFDSKSAPYAANDVTPQLQSALNKK